MRPGGWRRRPFLVGLVAGLVLVAVVVGIGQARITPSTKCPEGSLPATSQTRGGDCFPAGADLPSGYTLDPGGNEGLPRD